MQQYADIYLLQSYSFTVNKYLHIVESVGFLFTLNTIHPHRTLPKISLFTIRVFSAMANLLTLGSTHPLAVSPPKYSHNIYVCTAVHTE